MTKVGGIVAVLAVPVFAVVASPYQRNLVVSISIVVIVAVGLNLLVGHAGQISLASGLFMAVGVYTAAVVGSDHGLPVVVSVGAAFAAAAATGAVLGPVALRVHGNYLAVVTLGALLVGEYVLEQWESLTGGTAGRSLTGVTPSLDKASVTMPFGVQPRDVVWAWLASAVALVALLAGRTIERSASGRALKAVRDHRRAAAVLAIDERRVLVTVFAVSGGMAGVAGALHGSFQGFVAPSEFSVSASIEALTAVVIGGVGTTWGPLWGAMFVVALPGPVEFVSRLADLPFVAGDRGGAAGHVEIATVNELAVTVALVAVLVIEPGGITSLARRLRRALHSLFQSPVGAQP